MEPDDRQKLYSFGQIYDNKPGGRVSRCWIAAKPPAKVAAQLAAGD